VQRETGEQVARSPQSASRRLSGSRREPKTKLEWAVDAARMGYRVFPCAQGGRTPLDEPGIWGARRHEDEIKAWWACYPDANIGTRLGEFYHWRPGAAAALCVDPSRGANLAELEIERGLLPNSRVVSAPGGVIQIHMRAHLPSRLDFLGPGFDLRSAGDYVLLPGSRIGDEEYRWRRLEVEDRNVAIDPPPEWFPSDGGRPVVPEPRPAWDAPEAIAWAVAYLRRAEEGNIAAGIKSRVLRNAISALARRRISESTALGLVAFHFAPRCSPGTQPYQRPNDLLRQAVRSLYADLNTEAGPPPHSTR
jgi:Bifunctional DNA primase/polymerase, N-terminal